MVTHTLNVCSAFKPSKCTYTHSSEHTQREHTPGAVGSHIAKAPGSSWGSGALLKGLTSVVVLKVERERWLFTPKSKWLDNRDCLVLGGIQKRSEFQSLLGGCVTK